MVNKQLVKEWVGDLRSGKFAQGRSSLKRGNSYCCLGVMCETYKRLTGKGEWETNIRNEDEFIIYDIDGCMVIDKSLESSFPPSVVAGFFGLNDKNPFLKPYNVTCSMANDKGRGEGTRFTFDQIADAIEKTYLIDDEETQEIKEKESVS